MTFPGLAVLFSGIKVPYATGKEPPTVMEGLTTAGEGFEADCR